MDSSDSSTLLAVLALLATAGLIGATLMVLLWARWRGQRTLSRRMLLVIAGTAALYLVVLIGAGLSSHTRVLPAGSEKYFCELDCHLAYRVTGLHSLDRAGSTPEVRVWAVTLQARFDQQTISPSRSTTAPTWPAPRMLALVDASGRRYPLVAAGSDTAVLQQPLRPGEQVTATVLFELPAAIEPRELLLADRVLVSRLLIGHERSPFHAPILLALPAPA